MGTHTLTKINGKSMQ